MINPNGKHTIRPEEAPYEIAYTLLLVTPYYAVFGEDMIQHGAAYPLLLILKDLDSGEVDVLPPPEIRYTLKRKVRNKLKLAQERSRKFIDRALSKVMLLKRFVPKNAFCLFQNVHSNVVFVKCSAQEVLVLYNLHSIRY